MKVMEHSDNTKMGVAVRLPSEVVPFAMTIHASTHSRRCTNESDTGAVAGSLKIQNRLAAPKYLG